MSLCTPADAGRDRAQEAVPAGGAARAPGSTAGVGAGVGAPGEARPVDPRA